MKINYCKINENSKREYCGHSRGTDIQLKAFETCVINLSKLCFQTAKYAKFMKNNTLRPLCLLRDLCG